jgi:hypothetical protein
LLTAFRLRPLLYDSKPDSWGRNCVLNNITFFSRVLGKGKLSHFPLFRSPFPYAMLSGVIGCAITAVFFGR